MKTIKMPLLVAAAFAALTSSTNAQSWLTNGLVAYYPFDGNANNAVNGSQAIVFGSPTPAPDRNGRSNGALHFDGSSYLNIGSFPALGRALSGFTVSFWFNAQAAANIIGDHQIPGQTSYTFDCILDSTIDLEPSSQSALTGRIVLFHDPTPPVTTYKWFSFVYSFDGLGHAAGYINGALVATAGYDPQQAFGTGRDWLVGIGSHGDDPRIVWYRGEIDELRIYSRAISASEVAQLYAIESESPQTSIEKSFGYATQSGGRTVVSPHFYPLPRESEQPPPGA